jgi:hypothetical protein
LGSPWRKYGKKCNGKARNASREKTNKKYGATGKGAGETKRPMRQIQRNPYQGAPGLNMDITESEVFDSWVHS